MSDDQPEASEFYTFAQAAAELGLAYDTVKDAVRRGTIPVLTYGPRMHLITRTALDDYRRDHLRKGKPPTKQAEWARAYRERKKSRTGGDTAKAWKRPSVGRLTVVLS